MSALLAYRWYLLRRNKTLWGLLCLLLILGMVLEQMTTSAMPDTLGENFFTKALGPFSQQSDFFRFCLTAERWASGATISLAGAVIGTFTICDGLQGAKALVPLAAGHSQRRGIQSECLMATALGLGFLLVQTGLELLCGGRTLWSLSCWEGNSLALMLGLRLVLCWGDLALFLLLSLLLCCPTLVLVLAMAAVAMELLPTGGTIPLPTGVLRGIFLGTAGLPVLLGALAVTGLLTAACFLMKPSVVFRA
jgi:hypothetical protein